MLPVSPYDDEIRFRIARAIYNNAAFWHYAAMPNPPIHIVVKNGHVDAHRRGAEQRRPDARAVAGATFGAFSVKNDLKTDAEMKDLLEKL